MVEPTKRTAIVWRRRHPYSPPITRGEDVRISEQIAIAVSYGAGINSTALLCGLRERDIRPDIVTFADTGAEKPETYEYIEMMKNKLKEWFSLELTIARKLYQGQFEGLEGQCIRRKELPSLAYGRRSCSIKYKVEPQERALATWMKENMPNKRVRRAIGYDVGERHRAERVTETKEWIDSWYPLIEWGWFRADCVKAICRAGLPQPGKSSCFFCPATRRSEVALLRVEHPNLLKRALEIERLAQETLRSDRGLGGAGIHWRTWVDFYETQGNFEGMDLEPVHIPCGCFDGSDGNA